MFGSVPIGSVLGITVRMHVLLLFAALLLFLDRGAEGALVFAVLGVVVLLHEFGHGIVAQRLGIRVVDITLWPLGGIARMSQMPESSRVEALVALAGPATNFVLAALAGAAIALHLDANAPAWLSQTLRQFLGFNVFLGVFNLVPAFPADGGRVLRAWLARERKSGTQRDWLASTELAVRSGAYIAFATTVVGLVLVFSDTQFKAMGGALIAVALFLWWTGKQELAAVRARHAPNAFDALAALLRRTMAGGTGEAPARASQADPLAPPSATANSRDGYSAKEIEELERFRGSLRTWNEHDAD